MTRLQLSLWSSLVDFFLSVRGQLSALAGTAPAFMIEFGTSRTQCFDILAVAVHGNDLHHQTKICGFGHDRVIFPSCWATVARPDQMLVLTIADKAYKMHSNETACRRNATEQEYVKGTKLIMSTL